MKDEVVKPISRIEFAKVLKKPLLKALEEEAATRGIKFSKRLSSELFEGEDAIKVMSLKNNFLTLSDKTIYDLIPYLGISDMYVGNDSFGSHIVSQCGKKSIVFLLDSPKAYTDYSKNYYRILPEGYDIDEITHGTNADPNLISVDSVIEVITKLKN